MNEQSDASKHSTPVASVAETTYQAIFRRIVSGEYPPNSKLPTEAAFAAELGVSRPTVRAAIARLRESGLVASRRGSGSFVLKRPDAQMLSFAPIESISGLQSCFEYRIMLEGQAAYLAAERAGPEDLERMRQALAAMDRAVAERELMLEEDFAYHLAICAAANNPFFVDSFNSISEASHTVMNLALNLSLRSRAARLQTVQAEHRAIYEAIASGSGEAARHLMQSHITNARNRIFQGPDA